MKYLCVCLMVFAMAVSADQRVTRDEVARRVETVAKTPHPRLFATAEGFAELKARIPTDKLLRLGAEAVKTESDQILAFKPVTRIQTGRRLLTVSRNALYRISTLAMTYRLYGGDAYLKRAQEELLAVAHFSDWNPSHFLDVAEMSLAVAIGYDWLYNELETNAREEIAAGLTRHGIQTSLRSSDGWWVRAGNNWGQVCHAGLIAASLALAERDTDSAITVVHRAVINLPRPMSVYAPDGCYPEGPGYWSYGTDFNVIAIDLFEKCLGTDFGLASLPGFRETGSYLDRVTGPSGNTFNYADGGTGRGTNCAIWWFAKRFTSPELVAYFEHDAYLAHVQRKKKVSEDKGGNRLFPLTLFWLQPIPAGLQPKTPLLWNSGGPQPITIQRSSWDNNTAFFVGIKAGSPSGNHGHMDGGSFVLDAAGIRWAYDLGGENYYKIESRKMRLWDMRQDSDRWRVYRLATDSHNTLMINGCQQRVKGAAKVTSCEQAGDSQRVELDLSDLYTNATKVVRSGTLDTRTRTYTLTDTLAGLHLGDTVRWAMVTHAKPTIRGDELLLEENEKRLLLTAQTTTPSKWEVAPAEGPVEADWNTSNKGFTQVRLLLSAPVSGEVKITVTFKE
ncbi:MAG: heparinase II/III family protein [Kiritimatiellae bacterium]|nr:heparinase II/III family protein [Kiritimatiellia bacterium]